MANKKTKYKVPENPEEAELELNHMSDITWRIFRIMSEFVEGFQFLSEFKQEVTIFGSARLNQRNKWCKEAHKLGKMLAKEGYSVITGGGPGIMEAANRGAFEVDPKNQSASISCCRTNSVLISMLRTLKVCITFLLAR